MKHVIAYIFLVIFSFQMLPVKEIGKILFKGQITEEEAHTCGAKGDNGNSQLAKYNEFLESGFANDEHLSRIAFYNKSLSVAFSIAEKLPMGFIPDIPTPPPNC